MDDLIPQVKEKVGALISRPKMSEKLLNKPPFRFLHDTITAIIRKTGFGEGLYSEEEMDSSTFNEKGLKIAYLEKIFKLVGICQGAPLDIRAAKVVAGLEPENTSMFLIALASFASDEDFDSRAAVQQCLSGEAPTSDSPSHQRTESKAEEKDQRSHRRREESSKGLDDEDDVKRRDEDSKIEPEDMKRGPDAMDIPPAAERGKSRGGQRSGNRGPPPSSSGLGDGGMDRPANLDAEIEKCDGSNDITKELVGALIRRPKLSDKLLGKPPFRFLHDIISEITKQTGFAADLFSPEELQSENVKEKDAKIKYLDKIIQLVGIHLNTILEVKSQKVVAGLEAVNTNRFLQLLAVAATHMPDSSISVQAVHESLGISSNAQGNKRADSRPQQFEDKGEVDLPVHEDRDKAAPRMVEASPPQQQQQQQQHFRAESKDEDQPPVRHDHGSKQSFDDKPLEDDSHAIDSKADDVDKKSMRPTTARRRPPKVKDSTREVAPKDVAHSAKKTEGIMLDGEEVDEDDDIVEDDLRLADTKESDADRNNPQSKLVQDIMSRQAEQEAAAKMQAKGVDDESKEEKAETTKTGGIRLGRLRKTGADKKGSSSKGVSSGSDIERLRKAVQVLVQHTGPLGTCMDYIQEDVSIMTSELHRWEEDCRKYEIEVEAQKKKTEEILNPLQRELDEVQLEIQEQQMKVSMTKASIAKNEARIQQILRLTATA